MPVLDLLCRDERITRITLVEPDVYQAHNVIRHQFPASAVGSKKGQLAVDWIRRIRPELPVHFFDSNLLDPAISGKLARAVAEADIGVCAADNEPAKYGFDALMRRFAKPWTLGEVLSGGIGGFVHAFVPGGPCYGCVASHLQRTIPVEKPFQPDYSDPAAPVHEMRIPAAKTAIQVIAALHAHRTLVLMENPPPALVEFTSLLFTLEKVPDVFDEAYRPYRFRIARAADCLICRLRPTPASPEELDVALDQAILRLGDA